MEPEAVFEEDRAVKSNKQRRAEILARRRKRAEKARIVKPDPREILPPQEMMAPCNPALLAAYNSYGQPAFVYRGYYVDTPFECRHCGKQEVWRATQQKWWYEVAGGHVESRAKLCRSCRRVERERRTEARRIHLEGLARKRAAKRPA